MKRLRLIAARSSRAADSSAPAPAVGWDRPGLSDDAGCAQAGTTGLSPAGLAAADAGASFVSGFTLVPSTAPPYRRSIWPQIAARQMPLGPCKTGHESLPLRRGRPIN